MKKLLFVLLAVIMVLPSLTACQKTPESPIVIGKNNDEMIEQAQETLAPEIEKLPLTQRYAIKEHIEDHIDNGNLVINVDADVIVPNTEKLSITRAVPTNFSQETVGAFFSALCGDTVMYKPSPITKADIEQMILECEQQKAKYPEQAEDIDQTIARYKSQYETAPDQVQKEICDGTFSMNEFEKGDFYYGCTQQYVLAYEDPTMETTDGIKSGKFFQAYNNTDQSEPITDENGKKTYPSYQAYLEYADFDHYSSWDCYWNSQRRTVAGVSDMAEQELSAVGITPEDAIKQADALFIETQVPISVQDIIYVAADEPFYELSCSRQVDGANLTIGGEGVGGDGLSPYWAYERVRIWISGNGIFYFNWSSPYEVRDVEVENATLMSFEDIESIAYGMIKIVYAPIAKQEQMTTVNVTKVALQLQRIKNSEDNSEALLTPVWCFYGARQVEETVKNEGMMSDWEMGYMPMLIVNAINGSIIDLEKGY